MKTLIIYKSVHHMNTEQIATSMAGVLGAKLAGPEQVTPASIADHDLIGFGSGIYFGRHHKAIRGLVGRLPAAGKDTFVFSTSGAARDHNGPLIRQLEKRRLQGHQLVHLPGLRHLRPVEADRRHTEGPP